MTFFEAIVDERLRLSGPHDSVSHIVQVAAIIAAAASTALPPF